MPIFVIPKTLTIPPDHPSRRHELELKREEYRRRLETDAGGPYYIDSAIKFLILHCLLESEHGSVDCLDIFRALPSTQPEIWALVIQDPYVFMNACGVINRYCTGQLDKTIDGTGLPGLN